MLDEEKTNAKSGINISDTIVSNGWINLSDNDLVIIK